MIASGLEAYVAPSKETWRGWQWNQIVAHLPEFIGRPVPSKGSSAERRVTQTKTVLYLCGPNDFDGETALKHGFRSENLFACDMVEGNVLSARKAGRIAICGRIQDVLRSWPADLPLDVIVADMCCGFTSQTAELINSLAVCQAVRRGTVLSINLQRGRDAIAAKCMREAAEKEGRPLSTAKNRASWFFRVSVYCWSLRLKDSPRSYTDVAIREICNYANPKMMSYRSSKVVMDSMVLRWWENGSRKDSMLSETVSTKYPIPDNIRRRIAALRAIRTMKLRSAS